MKKTIFILLVAIVSLTGCGRKTVFQECREFPNEVWKFFEPEEFNVNIKNIDDCYDFYVTLVMDTTQIRENIYPLVINMYSSNDERRTFRSYMTLRNENGILMGEKDGKYLVCKEKIREYFFFNAKGTQRFELSFLTGKYEQSGIKSLTFSIEKAKLVYPE